ncbi:PA2169 family four-helix-bundle protein [Roseiterribacter gracilis]|uniref:Chemotaxis protein n=1 Tax=Roseiterribacter gracilis TaxID=2812848 RepID=A0A8S8XGP2_9PROT|nr:chemotaxis protein [Rhodospirillales bacterium TMPK1]
MADREHDISTLNSLIATTLDSADGYERAAEDATDAGLKQLFTTRGRERRGTVASLQSQVRALGGTPEDEGTTLAAMHRVFLDLKKVVGNDNKRVIEEVERGEDHIKAKFESALKDTDITTETRAVIQTAFTSVKSGHDQMSAMKRAAE